MSMKTIPVHATVDGRGRLQRLAVGLSGLCVLLAGCASSSAGNGSLDGALGLFGLQTRPPVSLIPLEAMPEMLKLPRKVSLRIHAGEVLNTDPAGRSLSLVVKVYRLKDADAFRQLPYETFKEQKGDGLSSMPGVIDVREIVLRPGQQHEVVESLPVAASHLAVVALFRSPDPHRWRFVFDARSAAQSGITLGAHGCALSVAVGQAVDAAAESTRLAGVRCR